MPKNPCVGNEGNEGVNSTKLITEHGSKVPLHPVKLRRKQWALNLIRASTTNAVWSPPPRHFLTEPGLGHRFVLGD